MSANYDDVHTALTQGLTAAEYLLGYVLKHKPYASDITEHRISAIRRGIAALDELRDQAKPCTRPHIEFEDESEPGCRCNTVKYPPCGWCENGGDPDASATQPLPPADYSVADAMAGKVIVAEISAEVLPSAAEAAGYYPDLGSDYITEAPQADWSVYDACARPKCQAAAGEACRLGPGAMGRPHLGRPLRSTCCRGTGMADYAAVPCPNPKCPVLAAEAGAR